MIRTALRRFLTLAATGVAVVVTGLVTAGPAAAEELGVSVRQGAGMSLAEIILVFIGIPALIYAVCAALVYLTSGRGSADRQWWTDADYYSAGSGSAAGAAPSAGGAAEQGSAGGTSANW